MGNRAGSSPVARTISSVHNGFELWTLDFFVISSFFVMYGAGFEACSFVLCGFGNIHVVFARSLRGLGVVSTFGNGYSIFKVQLSFMSHSYFG